MSSKRIKLAQDVLKIEANEITIAASRLSNEFSQAVDYDSSM